MASHIIDLEQYQRVYRQCSCYLKICRIGHSYNFQSRRFFTSREKKQNLQNPGNKKTVVTKVRNYTEIHSSVAMSINQNTE